MLRYFLWYIISALLKHTKEIESSKKNKRNFDRIHWANFPGRDKEDLDDSSDDTFGF